MDSCLQDRVDKWLDWDKNEKTRCEVQHLIKANNVKELRLRMEGNLSFGTAGVRCRMEAGFARLNELTVIQLSCALARHLITELGGNVDKNKGIVIGYDGRHQSKRFAELAANVLLLNGLKVFIFSEVVPTPVVSFAVVALRCDAGIMITASHNPKEDNGFKAYWANGAQILAPHDTEICRIVAIEPKPADSYWETSLISANPLMHSADSVLEQYFSNESAICSYHRSLNTTSQLRITYSAFHGVGSRFVRRMFAEFGFPPELIFYVKEQDEPDPNFSTVSFPNPEEGHRVLSLCFETADVNDSTLILANDPDADRLQLAEKESSGEWRVFSGNEMGILLTWWVWTNWREKNPTADASRVFVLHSAVSSQMVSTMAVKEGFKSAVSLTGFKYIGNLAQKLRSEGKEVIVAWEESIGFTSGTTLDKDGVSSAAVFAEMANWLHTKKHISLRQQLFRLYFLYGFHLQRNSYWIVKSAEVTKQMFADIRSDYPKKIGQNEVEFVRDLTTGYDNAQPDNKAILPLSTSSEMVTFTLANGSIVTLRASGTEPKLKYYIELRTEPGIEEKDLDSVVEVLDQLEDDVVQTLLQPAKYGLTSRRA
uniref:Phosphoglucomutase (alpha-D-glucose-1,6-bisphosphate-dependent) n=1 Tax=Globodera rostochiensis TaxID=31243 RepID=A0A914HW65_GLORO